MVTEHGCNARISEGAKNFQMFLSELEDKSLTTEAGGVLRPYMQYQTRPEGATVSWETIRWLQPSVVSGWEAE